MSTTINPAMQSVAMSYMPPQDNAAQKQALEITDRTAPQNTSAGNTTVTLSGQVESASDYRDLASSRTVNQNSAVEDRDIETNDTTNKLTYAANLQAQANYNAQQLDQVANGSMETGA